MTKAVFTQKPESIYDDDPCYRYHFPDMCLKTVENALGDFVVYYEPGRRGLGHSGRTGRQAYFATARVVRIDSDPRRSDHYYALVDDYLDFERAVPIREGGEYYERRLRKPDGSTNKGLFGRNVRRLEDDEYEAICRAGFPSETALILPSNAAAVSFGLQEELVPFKRPLVERLVTRPFRDAAFAKAVQSAYEQTCSFTGLRILNGEGRPEVQAAHIRPVRCSGRDTVRNGIALSGTVHWMFDRGLISIGDDYSILITKHGLPENAVRLLNPDRKLILPKDDVLRPARDFLEYHRQEVFKG